MLEFVLLLLQVTLTVAMGLGISALFFTTAYLLNKEVRYQVRGFQRWAERRRIKRALKRKLTDPLHISWQPVVLPEKKDTTDPYLFEKVEEYRHDFG